MADGRKSGLSRDSYYKNHLELVTKENQQLKQRLEQLERQNRDLKKSLFDLSMQHDGVLTRLDKKSSPFNIDSALDDPDATLPRAGSSLDTEAPAWPGAHRKSEPSLPFRKASEQFTPAIATSLSFRCLAGRQVEHDGRQFYFKYDLKVRSPQTRHSTLGPCCGFHIVAGCRRTLARSTPWSSRLAGCIWPRGPSTRRSGSGTSRSPSQSRCSCSGSTS